MDPVSFHFENELSRKTSEAINDYVALFIQYSNASFIPSSIAVLSKLLQ